LRSRVLPRHRRRVGGAALLLLASCGGGEGPAAEPSPDAARAPVAPEDPRRPLPTGTSVPLEVLAALPPGQMTPYAEELLEEPIELAGCPGVRIVEWRPTAGREAWTAPTWAAVDLLDVTCQVAVAAFHDFVIEETGLSLAPLPPWQIDVSLLPSGREGAVPRTLADHDGRFLARTKKLDAQDRPLGIWGYAEHRSHFVYVRNDVLEEDGSTHAKVLAVVAHELFHAMSWQSGLHDALPPPASAADEALARAFTIAIGLE